VGAAVAAMLAWRLNSGSAGAGLLVAAWLVFLLGGMTLGTVDVAVHRLPTPVVYATAAGSGGLLAVAALATGQPTRLVGGVLGAAAVGAAYVLMAVVAGTQIGLGDVRVAALAGLLLGSVGWSTVVLGTVLPFVLALPLAVVRALRSRGSKGRQSRFFAFGPSLPVPWRPSYSSTDARHRRTCGGSVRVSNVCRSGCGVLRLALLGLRHVPPNVPSSHAEDERDGRGVHVVFGAVELHRKFRVGRRRRIGLRYG
jgi:hypothetical protein